MELIRVVDLFKTYTLGEIDVPVLKGVSFTINRGELVALMGASGSGKTTLMNILGCLDRPSSGEYWLDGEEMSDLTPDGRALVRTSKLGFVFQSFNLLPRTTAMNNVLMPLDYSPTRPHHGEAKHRALELLERVGLGQRLDHEPSQMSGGQQQRVAIARSLVNQPALVLADEPTGNLDSHTSVEILEMFQRLNAAGITVILVTHDAKVAGYATRVIRIADGLIESDSGSMPVPLPVPHKSSKSIPIKGHSAHSELLERMYPFGHSSNFGNANGQPDNCENGDVQFERNEDDHALAYCIGDGLVEPRSHLDRALAFGDDAAFMPHSGRSRLSSRDSNTPTKNSHAFADFAACWQHCIVRRECCTGDGSEKALSPQQIDSHHATDATHRFQSITTQQNAGCINRTQHCDRRRCCDCHA